MKCMLMMDNNMTNKNTTIATLCELYKSSRDDQQRNDLLFAIASIFVNFCDNDDDDIREYVDARIVDDYDEKLIEYCETIVQRQM
jgi:hypothetical protein